MAPPISLFMLRRHTSVHSVEDDDRASLRSTSTVASTSGTATTISLASRLAVLNTEFEKAEHSLYEADFSILEGTECDFISEDSQSQSQGADGEDGGRGGGSLQDQPRSATPHDGDTVGSPSRLAAGSFQICSRIFHYKGNQPIMLKRLSISQCEDLRQHGWVVVDNLVSKEVVAAMRASALGAQKKGKLAEPSAAAAAAGMQLDTCHPVPRGDRVMWLAVGKPPADTWPTAALLVALREVYEDLAQFVRLRRSGAGEYLISVQAAGALGQGRHRDAPPDGGPPPPRCPHAYRPHGHASGSGEHTGNTGPAGARGQGSRDGSLPLHGATNGNGASGGGSVLPRPHTHRGSHWRRNSHLSFSSNGSGGGGGRSQASMVVQTLMDRAGPGVLGGTPGEGPADGSARDDSLAGDSLDEEEEEEEDPPSTTLLCPTVSPHVCTLSCGSACADAQDRAANGVRHGLPPMEQHTSHTIVPSAVSFSGTGNVRIASSEGGAAAPGSAFPTSGDSQGAGTVQAEVHGGRAQKGARWGQASEDGSSASQVRQARGWSAGSAQQQTNTGGSAQWSTSDDHTSDTCAPHAGPLAHGASSSQLPLLHAQSPCNATSGLGTSPTWSGSFNPQQPSRHAPPLSTQTPVQPAAVAGATGGAATGAAATGAVATGAVATGAVATGAVATGAVATGAAGAVGWQGAPRRITAMVCCNPEWEREQGGTVRLWPPRRAGGAAAGRRSQTGSEAGASQLSEDRSDTFSQRSHYLGMGGPTSVASSMWVEHQEHETTSVDNMSLLDPGDREEKPGLEWQEVEGEAVLDVAPLGGRMLLFLAGAVEHSVAPATTDMATLTAWF